MALAFMLNPARTKRRGGMSKAARSAAAKKGWRRRRAGGARSKSRRTPKWVGKKVKNMTFQQCLAASRVRGRKYKCRTKAEKAKVKRARKTTRLTGGSADRSGVATGGYGDILGAIQTNPRKRRKGGSSMAKTKRRRSKTRGGWTKAKRAAAARKGWRKRKSTGRVKTKRRRKSTGWTKTKRRKAGLKSWRKRVRKYPKYKSSVKRRGYKNPRRNPARRNPARRKRRRNSMYSGRLYARNPGRLFGSLKGALDPKLLTQLAVGAAAATVTEMLGTVITGKIASFAPSTFVGADGKATMVHQIVGALVRVVTALALAQFVAPARFKTAVVLGGGSVAAQPLVSGLLAPVLKPLGDAIGAKPLSGVNGGIGGWISASEVYGGRRGMGAYLTARQMPGVGLRGMSQVR